MPRESWEALDSSEDDKVDQSADETRAPVPIVVQDHQIQTHSKKYTLASNSPSWVGGEFGGGDVEKGGSLRGRGVSG